MGARETLGFWPLTLLILSGVLGGQWAVWYPEKEVCAVRGSTVVIPCTYDYLEGNQVKQTMWCHNHENCIQSPYVCHSENVNVSLAYKNRAECLGDKKNCTLKIRNIRHTDTGMYRFRFITDENKWFGSRGIAVLFEELRVKMASCTGNGTVRDGDSVNLTCGTDNCSPSQSEFIWFKEKQRLLETRATLHFSPVSLRDSGTYSCALKDNEETISVDFSLEVETNVPDPDINMYVIPIISTAGILLIVIAAVIVIYIKCRKTASFGRKGRNERANKNSLVYADTFPVQRTTTPVYSNLTFPPGVRGGATNDRFQTSTVAPIYDNIEMRCNSRSDRIHDVYNASMA